MTDVVLLEFNEINQQVLLDMVQTGKLPNLKCLIDHGKLATTSVDAEYDMLEPWIQWVTAHTGKSQREHKAFNLSDVQHTHLQQIWGRAGSPRRGLRPGVADECPAWPVAQGLLRTRPLERV